MVRLKDIAARAGVSIMTVSKALRDERDVSPTTRERIQKLARQMGYVPDSAAQGLRAISARRASGKGHPRPNVGGRATQERVKPVRQWLERRCPRIALPCVAAARV